jgi:hypothetical protein
MDVKYFWRAVHDHQKKCSENLFSRGGSSIKGRIFETPYIISITHHWGMEVFTLSSTHNSVIAILDVMLS